MLLAVAATLLATSCATLINGRDQDVPVTSVPEGASIVVECLGDGPRPAGVTPAIVKLHRSAEACRVMLSKDGYDDATVTFRRFPSRAAAANIAPSFILGALTELAAALPIALSDSGGSGKAAEAIGQAGYAAGSSAPYAVDERTGAGYIQMPERVELVLVARADVTSQRQECYSKPLLLARGFDPSLPPDRPPAYKDDKNW
jgi:hypothetical protein